MKLHWRRWLRHIGLGAVVLVLMVTMGLASTMPSQALALDESITNEGDPFENGDLVWNSYLQTYLLEGFEVWLYQYEDGGNSSNVPFDYPNFLNTAAAAGANFEGWGVSDFVYDFASIANGREIKYSSLPSRAHCCQSNNGTTTENLHKANLVLDPDLSGWEENGSVYHAVFVFFAFNELGSGTGGAWDQATIGWDYVHAYWRVGGKIDISKTSSNASITNDSACYSLEGARYDIVNEETGSVVDVLVSNVDGFDESEVLPVGDYLVRESAPPQGYVLDSSEYRVTVQPGETVHVNAGCVFEEPLVDTVKMIVGKIDDAVQANSAQGSATLAGAQFAVRYFDNVEGDVSGEPKRSWILETDSDGYCLLDEEHFVSGDDYYRDDSGTPVLPLGSIAVQEVRAADGYLLGDQPVFTQVIKGNDAGGTLGQAYNEPTMQTAALETVQRGDMRLVKIVNTGLDQNEPQADKPVFASGVQFELYNDADQVVVSPEDGVTLVQPGERVCTITVDESGLASTRNGSQVNGWDIPAGWHGALAVGTYTVHEAIPDSVQSTFKQIYGSSLMPADDWKITIQQDGQYDAAPLVNDVIPQTPLRVIKIDAESGKRIPLPCSFQIFDEQGNLVEYAAHYPEEETMSTWSTNAEGVAALPMLLKEGAYEVREITAPEGYVIAAEPVRFTIRSEYSTWANPVEVTLSDTSIKAKLNLVKTDTRTGEPIEGAQYLVEAASDITTPEGTIHARAGEAVDTLITDEHGRAVSKELYLGVYNVREMAAPDGYAIDREVHTVRLESAGQEVPVVEAELQTTDTPTTLHLKKTDSAKGEPLAGAHFRIWNNDGFDQEYETNEEGEIDLPYVLHGSYTLQEVYAPFGYWIEEDQREPIRFLVDDQGLIGREDQNDVKSELLAVECANVPVHISTKAESEAGTQYGGISDTVTIIDTVEYHGCTPGETYTLFGELHVAIVDDEGNTIDGGRLEDASGNALASQTTFVPDAYEGLQEVSFTVDGKYLSGATVVVFEKLICNDAVLAEHADITDKGQTVYFPENPVSPASNNPVVRELSAKTGDAGVLILMACAVGALGSVLAMRWIAGRSRRELRRQSLSSNKK